MAGETVSNSIAHARAVSDHVLQRNRHNDEQTQYACGLGAMEAHLADMYRRFGIPDEHRELVDPTCPDR